MNDLVEKVEKALLSRYHLTFSECLAPVTPCDLAALAQTLNIKPCTLQLSPWS